MRKYKNHKLILVFLLTLFSLKAQQKHINIKIHVKGNVISYKK